MENTIDRFVIRVENVKNRELSDDDHDDDSNNECDTKESKEFLESKFMQSLEYFMLKIYKPKSDSNVKILIKNKFSM